MSIETNLTKLEEIIIRNAREALEELMTFEASKPSSVEGWFEALNHGAEANALIKLALEKDGGMGEEAVAVLKALEPLVIKAFVALRNDAPTFH
ncbi:hypothetical protein JC795_26550 [Pseudomonas veronii]|uniref:hypothetical protein n=1 Tax=Pseudomonas veronii TaxID=76761 RepID=UPI0018E88019|nr:hypothetical protein [Pseudomonas veronii]MBJ2181745.1 hypothetical protein [Pseudomonas veronii]